MGLAAGIILIFIIMVAFFISYGTSFKLKNGIVNKIEQSEGMSSSEINSFINGKANKYNGKTVDVCYNEILDIDNKIKGFTVEVVVYMEMDKTILGEAFNVKIPIKGETRIIEKGNYLENLGRLNIQKCSNGYTTITN